VLDNRLKYVIIEHIYYIIKPAAMTHLILIQPNQMFFYRQTPVLPDRLANDVQAQGMLPDYIKAEIPSGKASVKYAAHTWSDWVVLLPVDQSAAAGAHNLLTRRQLDVLIGLSQGLTGKQIAARLNISRRSVSLHVAGLKTNLAASTTAECVQKAARLGILNRADNR
jgi:DNA-binding NarL/FixJ family response regulator